MKQYRHKIRVTYTDSWQEVLIKDCKKIKSTSVYKYYIDKLNRGLCKRITITKTEI
jgi:hypothetical protein